MGKPRAAKKKTTVILPSDDEGEKDDKPKKRSVPSKKTADTSKIDTPQRKRTRKESITSPASQPSPSPKKQNTLFSFFNTATQKQQSTNSIEIKKVELVEDIEDIDLIQDDDSFEEELANLSDTRFGTKYPIPVRRKRKIHDLDTESSSLPRGSQLFKRPALDTNDHSGESISVTDQRPWTEKYGPINLDELAVHKKKVQDVMAWLRNVVNGQDRKRLLILKGAAGTGKTTTVNMISKDLGLHINEWRALAATSSEEGFVSMSAQFEDFVARTGTFGTLDFALASKPAQKTQVEPEKRELVLIEEFPNTFSRSSSGLQSFRIAVLHYLEATTRSTDSLFAAPQKAQRPVVPIVMIISESLLSTSTAASDSFTAYRLLGPDILNHAGATVIEFNPIAPTYMTKALDVIIQKEARQSGRRRAPGPSVLKHLAEIGDIRSAVSSLEFLCLRSDESCDWSGRVTFSKQKRGTEAPLSKMETESLEIITQRESTLGIFHAVGKVVYNKRDAPPATDTPPPQPPPHLSHFVRSKMPEVNVQILLNELGTDISTFVAALHENYLLSCAGIDDEDSLDHVNNCIDYLSDADILSPDRFGTSTHSRTYAGTGTDSLRQDEISFQTSVRGILFSLPHPVKRIAPPGANVKGKAFGGKSQAYQMFYPASLRIWRKQEEMAELLDLVVAKMRDRSSLKAVKDTSKATSVEAWRLSRFSGQQQNGALSDTELPDDSVPSSVLTGSSAKKEMLIERLPYMSLLKRHRTSLIPGDIGRDLDKITKITGAATTVFLDAVEEEEEVDVATEVAEQWSTDKPVEEGLGAKRKLFGLKKNREASITVPVKEKMANLVLEDDDIED